MKDLLSLLNKTNDTFTNTPSNYKKKEKKVKDIKTYKDIVLLNGEDRVKERYENGSLDFNRDILLERVINKNHLMDISFLTKGLKVAKTVCRIILVKGQEKIPIGTGFLVENGLLMTNNHVLKSKRMAERFVAEFEYENKEDGRLKNTFLFQLHPERFFMTNRKLDYTVVAIGAVARNNTSKRLEEYGYNRLSLSKTNIIEGEAVSIIQHPKGLPKMIAMRENIVVDIQSEFIHYTTDTQQGSSGSLVANDQWEIVALHRSGVPDRDEEGNIKLTKRGIYQGPEDEPFIKWIANQGVMMDAILKDINAKKVKRHEVKLKKALLEGYQVEADEEDYELPSE